MTNSLNIIKFPLPSTDALNIQSATRTMLLLLRCLHTSDMTFAYMLFEKSTLNDIQAVCEGLFNEENAIDLTSDETIEFLGYCNNLREYILQ